MKFALHSGAPYFDYGFKNATVTAGRYLGDSVRAEIEGTELQGDCINTPLETLQITGATISLKPVV